MNTQHNVRIDVIGDTSDFTSGAREAARELSELKDAAYKTAAGFASFVSAGALVSAASSLVDAQMAAQKLAGSLAYSTGSAGEASIALDYLREVTRRLGVDFGTASDAYAKFAAASKGTGISAEAVKSVFEGVAAASMKLGLSAEETSGALLALSQMASKGVISAEELRGQLGERLPGAMKLAANAMGVTQAELSKLLETGQIMASDFLPKFGDALRNEFQGPAAGLVAEINRLNSAWDDWKRSLADSDGGGFKWLTRGINESSAAMRELGKEAGFVQKLLTAIGGFQFGSVGKGKFDTQQLQQDAFEKLATVRQGRQAMEGRHLTYLEQEQYRDLGRQENALRDQIQQLAERRGKETGLQIPDLAGEMQAQALKRKDALASYLKDVASEKDKAVAAETERWKALTAVIGTAGAEYEKALIAHNAKLADIAKKGSGKTGDSPERKARMDEIKDELREEIRLVNERQKAEKKAAADLLSQRQRGDSLLASYKRQDELTVERITQGAALAAMSERERTVAEAVYQAQDVSARRQEQIIRQTKDETERTRELSAEKSLLAEHIERVSAAAAKNYDAQRSFEFGWDRALKNYVDNATNAAGTAQQAFQSMTDVLENSLVSFATNTKFTFKDMAQSILRSLAQVAAKQAAMGLINLGRSAVSAWVGSSSTPGYSSGDLGGGVSSSSVQGSYAGNLNLNSGSGIRLDGMRAGGGDVQAGKTYLVGEQGPELLRMGATGGTVIPNSAMGGVSVQVSVAVDNRGNTEQGTSTSGDTSGNAKKLGEMIASASRRVIVEEMRSGGMLASVRPA